MTISDRPYAPLKEAGEQPSVSAIANDAMRNDARQMSSQSWQSVKASDLAVKGPAASLPSGFEITDSGMRPQTTAPRYLAEEQLLLPGLNKKCIELRRDGPDIAPGDDAMDRRDAMFSWTFQLKYYGCQPEA